MAPKNERAWLSPAELAEQYDISTRTAVRWVPVYGLGRKIGGRWRIDPDRARQCLALTTGASNDQRHR